ncbi:hypothetical protein [Halomonas sp. WWR20]
MVWQIIKRIFGNVLPWLLAALLAFGVYQHTVAKRYKAERDTATQRADTLQSALAWQQAQASALSRALTERDAQLTRSQQTIINKLDSLDTLERDDEPTRDWSAEPVPSAVHDWVRKLSEDDDPDA